MVVRYAALLTLVTLLAACGQKGPLYLPDKGGEVVTRPGGQATQQQAPQSQPPGSQAAPGDSTDEQKKNQQGQQSPRD